MTNEEQIALTTRMYALCALARPLKYKSGTRGEIRDWARTQAVRVCERLMSAGAWGDGVVVPAVESR